MPPDHKPYQTAIFWGYNFIVSLALVEVCFFPAYLIFLEKATSASICSRWESNLQIHDATDGRQGLILASVSVFKDVDPNPFEKYATLTLRISPTASRVVWPLSKMIHPHSLVQLQYLVYRTCSSSTAFEDVEYNLLWALGRLVLTNTERKAWCVERIDPWF